MKFTIAACVLFLMGCGDVAEKPSTNLGTDTAAKKQMIDASSSRNAAIKKDTLKGLVLQTFGDIPKEISGCSGLYKSSKCKEACDYIFTSNLQGKAFIKVEGKLISLKRTSSTVTEKKTKERYEGEGYNITIEVYPVKKTGDEVWEYYGELKVVKGDLKISESITGEAGC